MKVKLFPFLTFILFISNLIFSQSISFDKDYPTLGYESEGYIVEQTSDGGYIIGGVADAKLIIAKTDSLGMLIFSKEFDRNKDPKGLRTFPVHVTNDGGFIVTTGKPSTNGSDLFLAKLDADGNTVWEKTYQDSQFVFGSDVVETDNGDFLTIGYVERNIVSLTKTDSDGSLIWSKTLKFNTFTQLLKGPMLTKLSDSNFLLANDRVLQKFNTNGDSLWQINSGFKVSSIKQTRNGRMIAAGYRKFAVINLDGIVEFEQSLGFTVDAGDNTLDNGFIFLANGNTITKTDSLGEIEWEKDIIGTGNYIVSTSDGGYAATGDYLDNLRLLKTNNSGEFEAIYITNPEAYKSLAIFQEHVIEWYSNGIENVDIEYSIDNGANWLEVVSNYPADSSNYRWFVPNTPSDNCNLRISASNNSDVFHKLDTVFNIMAIQNYDYIAVNECKMWIGNNGMSAHNPITDASGFFWPGGEDAEIGAIFADGILWGGIHQGMIKVNGATYRYGLQPGQILEKGKADNPNQSKYKIFKINKNWASLPEGPIKDRLEYDYNNWPGDLGAPYIDVNNDGIFTKGIDKPDFIGDEVLFYVANDLDSLRTTFTYGSPSIGLEFQQTLFAYNTPELKDAVFKKVKLINKSNFPIDSMYLSYWTDDDLGFAGDDFVGFDKDLGLGFSYNGDNFDDDFYGSAPPAVGHLLLQGPIVKSNLNDSAKFNGNYIKGYTNLSMTSSHFYIGGSSTCLDPALGRYEGTFELYNQMQGRLWNGDPLINPITEDTSIFVLDGDPVNKVGWYEGEGWPGGPEPSDRRFLMSSGPFTMAPCDTQEVVYAIFMARGSDNIQSVEELKKTARVIHEFWGNNIPVSVNNNKNQTPTQFSLSQNYPNPFNPSTTISFSLPKKSDVNIKIYNTLGQLVETLYNGETNAGYYDIVWNANVASGVYYYTIKAGDFVDSKKMVFLK